MLPKDAKRRELLLEFQNKICSKQNVNFSTSFYKKNPDSSIKKEKLTALDFELVIQKNESFKNILIIDDAINEGSTLNILLEKLYETNLINPETNIKFVSIYGFNMILKPKVSVLDASKKYDAENKSSH